jgi:hypothetical protein
MAALPADAQPVAAILPTQTPTIIPATAPPTATSVPSPTPSPTTPPTATPTPSAVPTATATPEPEPRLIAGQTVSFTPSDKAVRANIRLALAHYYGALTHVVLPPGGVFSFNATLGLHPQGLPWKYVKVKPTAAPAPPPPEGTAPITPTLEPAVELIQGGGLCDLASRFVMAARPLLPNSAFRFVNHVRSNGVHLNGVPARDSVSIWAIGGGKGEQDLLITNVTAGWLEFQVERDGEKIIVHARLWDRSPPGW